MLPETVSSSRVWRLWSSLGLALPRRRPCRRRSASDTRISGAVKVNHVWSYDIVHDRLTTNAELIWHAEEYRPYRNPTAD